MKWSRSGNNPINPFLIVVIIGLTLFVAFPVSAATIISMFDVDNEGWTTDSGGAFTHEASGGNPGGFLRLTDIGSDTYVAFPPSKFLGNLIEFDGGLLSYDILAIQPTSVGSGFGRIQLNCCGNPNATFDYAGNPPVPSSEFWTTYEVPMTASAWNTTQEQWEQVLSDVSFSHITLDLGPGNDIIGFDNFQLALAPVPEPSSLFLLGGGLLGLMGRRRKSTL